MTTLNDFKKPFRHLFDGTRTEGPEQTGREQVTGEEQVRGGKDAFEMEFSKITDYAAATLAANNPPAKKLTAEIQVFKEADAAVNDLKGKEKWDEAQVALPALANAAKVLAAGKKDYDAKKTEFEQAWKGMTDRAEADIIISSATPKKLDTVVTEYKDKKKIVTNAEADEEWQTAKDGVDPMQKAAKALVEAKEDYDTKKVEFEQAWKGMTDRAGAEAIISKATPKPLDAAVAEYKAKKQIVTDAEANEEWQTAKDGVDPMQKAAKALVEAQKEFVKKWAFDKAWADMKDSHHAAKSICVTKPMPGKYPAEIKEFRKVDTAVIKAVKEKDWVRAKDSLPPLKAAIAKVVPAFNDWKPFGNAHETNLYILEKARALAAVAPAKLKDEKKVFEAEDAKIDPAVNGKKWGEALAALNLAVPAAKTLIAAQEQYDKEKKPFDDAVKAAQTDYEAALAVLAALPSGLADNPKVTAFKEAQTAVENARKDEKWSEGAGAANTLQMRSKDLVDAKDEFNTAFTAEDAKDIPNKLEALELQTNKALDPAAAPFIDPLQEKVRNLVVEVNDKVSAKDYVTAAAVYEKLVAATDAMEKAKEGFKLFKQAFDAVLNGEDKDARAKGAEPAPLAKLRNTALDKLKEDASNLGDAGKLPIATKKVAAWKEEAKGWIDGWTEAIEAQAALSEPNPDGNKLKDVDTKLKALAAKSGGGKVIDEMIKALGPRPSRTLMKTVMKARFGVEIDLKKFKLRKDEGGAIVYSDPPTNKKPDYDQIDDPMDKGSKSVKKLYELMTEVPEEFVANSPSLKKIVRVGGRGGIGDTEAEQKKPKVGQSFYRSAEELIVLECGRQSDSDGTIVGKTKELPDVTDELYKPEGGSDKKMPRFDWTTYHEIGHAVDDRKGFMAANGAKPDFGGWVRHGNNIEPIAKAIHGDDRFKADGTPYNLEYIKELLEGKAGVHPKKPPKRPDKAIKELAWAKARQAIEKWVDSARTARNPWKKGDLCKQQAIGGRVYHEGTDGEWYSYDLAARAKGISGYQFRAPGEFFAELHAAYYAGVLKPGHPFVKIVESL
jgi:hypothetical protein